MKTNSNTQGKEIHYQSLDGINLYAQEWGSTDAHQTVLCLHGLTRNSKDFIPLSKCIQGTRMIAWDTRGRGQSQRDPNPGNYQLSVYVQDVLALIDHLKLDQFAIIGTSMGGLIAMQLMAIIPEKITGVVLNDIGPELEDEGIRRIAGYVDYISCFDSYQSVGRSLKSIHNVAHPNFTDSDWIDFAKRTFIETDDGFVPDYDIAIADSLKNIETSTADVKVAWSLFDKLRSRPLLIIRGALSDLLSAETADKMAKTHDNAELVTVPDMGHAPVLNEEVCRRAISNFLNKLQ